LDLSKLNSFISMALILAKRLGKMVEFIF